MIILIFTLLSVLFEIILIVSYKMNLQIFIYIHVSLTIFLMFVKYKFPKDINYPFLIILFLPIFGQLIYIFILISFMIINRNDALNDYEKYINDYELVLEKKLSNFKKEINTISLVDALKRTNSEKKKDVLTTLISEDVEIKVNALRLGLYDKDPEVVHYSSTLLSEIERKFEENLSNSISKYEITKDKNLLFEISENYKLYLRSNLIAGELKNVYYKEYINYLFKLYNEFDYYDAILNIVDSYIEIKDFKNAKKLFNELYKLYNDDKRTYFMAIKLNYYLRNYKKIYEILEEFKSKNFKLTEDELKKIKYWSE